jgi:N-acetylneuraminic acid mutarotase
VGSAAAGRASAPAVPSASNTFVPTGSMSVRRAGATATLLPEGDVLVAGGGTAAAELYRPKTNSWKRTASMSTPRTNATATLLTTGDVLVAGGCCQPGNPYVGLASAELYHPSTGSWSPTGSLNVARSGHTATLLQNGQVLVAGGACNGAAYGCDAGSFLVNLRSAELYDPATGAWTKTGPMTIGRELQTATLLPNGEVLIAGGFNSCDDDFCSDLTDAELYDPVTGNWLATASMSAAREQHTATLLPSGMVLVAGGLDEGGFSGVASTLASAEIYNPIFGRWTPASAMNARRAGATATQLSGGWVLVTGGGTASSEVYQPGPGVWVPVGSLSTTRTGQTATLLPDGDVLVAGGGGPDRQPLPTAEVYQTGPGPLVSLSTTAITLPAQEVGTKGNAVSFTITNLGTTPLHVFGVDTSGPNPSDFVTASGCRQPVASGASCSVLVRFAPLFPGLRTATVDVADDAPLSPQGVAVRGSSAGPFAWVPTGSMSTPRSNFSSTNLADGRVLVAGGEAFFGSLLATAEVYDPGTGSFAPTGSLAGARELQAAARLPNGNVIVAGGYGPSGSSESTLSSAELYNPATGRWSPTGSMLVADSGLTATLLGNGLVLVTGFTGSNPEIYDPVHGTWSDTGPLPVSGEYGLAAPLHNGQVLLAAGASGSSAIYNPATNSWSATGSAASSHLGGTATTLANGEVLAAGGVSNGGYPLSSSELYDPSRGTWGPAGMLPAGREGQSAVLMPNDEVLLAGGCSSTCRNGPATDPAYIFNSGYWSTTGSLPSSRAAQEINLLPDGDVLLTGGRENDSSDSTTSAELYISPLITARPGRAAPGQTITIAGNGFFGHEAVVVRLSGPANRVVASPTADDLGQFTVRVAVPAVPAGTYQLSAQGQRSFTYATTTFVVT